MQSKLTKELRQSQRLSDTIEERFWKRVKKTDSCWIWHGAKQKGYGAMNRGGLRVGVIRSHQVSWMIHNGPIPEGMCVLHNCPSGDNPACVNPAHLWIGTQLENLRDMVKKGRHARHGFKGESHPGCVLTEKQVIEIRERYAVGDIEQRPLAKLYGIRQCTVSAIVRKKLWSHIG